MFKLHLIAGLLAALCAGSAAAASNAYYVVIPVKGRAAAPPAVNVSLSAYELPQATVGTPYENFNFNTLLSVTGDAAFTGSGVTWSVVAGSLPAGMTLSEEGTLSGTPSVASAGTITTQATYRNSSGQQTYQLVATQFLAKLTLVNSTKMDFGPVAVGVTGGRLRGIQNTGEVAVTGLSFSFPQGFERGGAGNCGSQLAPGQSCSFQTFFKPTAAESYGGQITVSGTNAAPVSFEVAGQGVVVYTASQFIPGKNASNVDTLTNNTGQTPTITNCLRTPPGGVATACTTQDSWPMAWPMGVGVQGVAPTNTYRVSLANGQTVVWVPETTSVTIQ